MIFMGKSTVSCRFFLKPMNWKIVSWSVFQHLGQTNSRESPRRITRWAPEKSAPVTGGAPWGAKENHGTMGSPQDQELMSVDWRNLHHVCSDVLWLNASRDSVWWFTGSDSDVCVRYVSILFFNRTVWEDPLGCLAHGESSWLLVLFLYCLVPYGTRQLNHHELSPRVLLINPYKSWIW